MASVACHETRGTASADKRQCETATHSSICGMGQRGVDEAVERTAARTGPELDLSNMDLSDGDLSLVLASVPDWTANFSALTTLELGRNQLGTVPDWIGNLTALTKLDLGRNQLGAVPDSIGNLTSLTTLDLSENHLPTVPDSIRNLTSLTTLNLRNNRLIGRDILRFCQFAG